MRRPTLQAIRRGEEFRRYRGAFLLFSRSASLPYAPPYSRTLYDRLARPLAQVSNDACLAQRLACDASVTPVQNKPIVRMPFVFRRHHLLQFHFDFERCFAGRQSGAVSDAKDVRIDGNRRLAEGNVEDDVGGLAADTGQRLQRFARARNLAAMFGDQLLRQRNYIFSLVAEQTDGLDEVAYARFPERSHFLRRIREGKK